MRSPLARAIIGIVLFLTAVIGGVASSYLTYEHVKAAPVATSRPASAPAGGSTATTTSAPASAPANQGFLANIGTGLADLCTGFVNADCETVSESRWGRFPFGQPAGKPSVPTSELGLIYFIFVFCWLLLIGSTTVSRWFVHFLFLLVAAAGVGASGFLDYIMWTQLAQWCPFCLTSHVASLVIFIGALLLWPRTRRPSLPDAELRSRLYPEMTTEPGAAIPAPRAEMQAPAPPQPEAEDHPWPTFHAVVAMLVVFVLATALQHAIWLTLSSKAGARAAEAKLKAVEDNACKTEKWLSEYWRKQFLRYDSRWQLVYMSWMYEPAIPIKTEGEPFRGPANAPHTIVLFSDLQCPACGRLDDFLARQVIPSAQQYGGVKLIFKHYPICLDCNPNAGRNLHPQACLAAQAVEAARILGGNEGFWKMHDWLGARRGQMVEMKTANKAWFIKQGRALGYDAAAFEKAMDSKEAMDRIRAHIAESQQLGKGYVPDYKLEDYKVTGTPTVIVDNRIMRTPDRQAAWTKLLSEPAPPPPGAMNQPRTESSMNQPTLMLGSQPPSAASRPVDRSRVILGPLPPPKEGR